MFQLYPDIKPYARHSLAVDDLHELYIDESGEMDGLPVIFLHSGPGSGCEFNSRCYFDPEKYRIVLFDQRGSGRSKPHGETRGNTIDHLISDVEAIREFLGIDKMVLFGGGWGSTLALAYSEAHPDRVLGIVLRGVFLGRQTDIDWFLQEGASAVYADYWEDFKQPIPEKAWDNLIEGYYQRINGADELAKMSAAKAWSMWEANCACLHPNQRLLKHYSNPHRSMARVKVGTHYFRNRCFLEDNQLLDNVQQIAQIPGIIVHGRYDMVSRFEAAHTLHKKWTNSQLYIIREAGHSATEPAVVDALIRATRDMANRLAAQ